MKTIILIFLILMLKSLAFCLDCKTISKYNQYLNSDYILLGKIVDVNSTTFKVKVIELYKGKYVDTLIINSNENSIFPEIDQIWLIYSRKIENQYFSDFCSLSRSFEMPFGSNINSLPPPPDEKTTFFDYHLFDINKKLSTLDLYNEIYNLRQLKFDKEINKFILINSKLEEQIKFNYLSSIMNLVLNFLFIVFAIYLINKKLNLK